MVALGIALAVTVVLVIWIASMIYDIRTAVWHIATQVDRQAGLSSSWPKRQPTPEELRGPSVRPPGL